MAGGDPEMFDLAEAGLPELPLLGRYTFRRAHTRLEAHMHPGCLELCCLARGQQTYRLTGGEGLPLRECRLRAGDVFITLPDERHDTAGQPQERGILYWLQFDLRRRLLLGLGREGSEKLRRALLTLPVRHFSGGREVLPLFAQLYGRVRDGGEDAGLGVLRLAADCLQLMLAVVEAAARWLGRALEFIDANIDRSLQVAQVARAAGLSESALRAGMLRQCGMPPGEYILRAKIRAAQRLLREGAGVTGTAHALGFSSSQYFATVFKRFTCLTPSQWLRQDG